MKNPNQLTVEVFEVVFTRIVYKTMNTTFAASQSTEFIRAYPILAKHVGLSDAYSEVAI